MASIRTFNIYGNFPLIKSSFIYSVFKCSSLQEYRFTDELLFGTCIFKSVMTAFNLSKTLMF